MVVMRRRADRMTSSSRRSARRRSLEPHKTVTQRRRSVVSSFGGRGSRIGDQSSGAGAVAHKRSATSSNVAVVANSATGRPR